MCIYSHVLSMYIHVHRYVHVHRCRRYIQMLNVYADVAEMLIHTQMLKMYADVEYTDVTQMLICMQMLDIH